MSINNKQTVQTTTTSADMTKTPEAPKWVAPATMPETVETYTVGEMLEMFAGGELLLPNFQRALVWPSIKGQVEAYLDTLITGKPVPARIWAQIPTVDGDSVYLLIDGYQRTSTERIVCDMLTEQVEGDENKAAQLDYIRNRVMTVQVVLCDNVREAAELFVRYNSGAKLDGIQRGKANLSEDKLAALKPYLEQVNRIDKARFGKKTPDAAAMMIAAATCDFARRNGSEKPRLYKRQTTSNGLTAAKVLATSAVVPAVPAPIVAVFDALNAVSGPTQAYWASPARLVPLCWAALATGADAQQLVDLMDTIKTDDGNDRRKWTVYNKVSGNGSKAMLTTANKTIADVFGDKSNAAGATGARADILAALLAGTPPINANRLGGKSADVVDNVAAALEDAVAAASANL